MAEESNQDGHAGAAVGDVDAGSATHPAVKYTVEQLTKMHVLFAHTGDHKSRDLAEEKQKEFEGRGGKISLVFQPSGRPATNDDLANHPEQVKIKFTYTKEYKQTKSISTKANTKSSAKAPRSNARPVEVSSISAPEPELAGLGWTKKEFLRTGGTTKTINKTDKYWYTPQLDKKLRSMTEVRRFLNCLQMTGSGDERVAFEWMQQGCGRN
jgi:hypothetical protein